jgi:hypothetical protein
VGELFDDFDAVHLARQLREDCGLVAQPGADLQHSVSAPISSKSVISATINGCEIVFSKPMGRGILA